MSSNLDQAGNVFKYRRHRFIFPSLHFNDDVGVVMTPSIDIIGIPRVLTVLLESWGWITKLYARS